MSNPPSLVRTVVSVNDLAQALGLYVDVLGLSLEHSSDDLATLGTGGGIGVMLHERETPEPGHAVSLTFAVEALDEVVAAWREAGGAIVDEPARQPWGEVMSVVRDHDGHVVCLLQV